MFSLDKSQFSIKEICDQLNFNVSTAYRILCTLEDYGYVSRLKNKEYVVGTQALYLSAIYTQSNHLEQIRPIVDRIRDISGETASFFVEEDNMRICLYRAQSRDEIRHNIEQGSRLELNRGGAGRIILAYGKRKNDKKGFYKEIRDKGYYLSINEHNAALFALAVPVVSNSGKFVGSITVSGPISRFDDEKKETHLNLLKDQLKNIVMP
jgi:DNA-binding IclR family transcriptional regulator